MQRQSIALTLMAAALVWAAVPASLSAQEYSSASAMHQLRAELVVVTELGRLMGFIVRMQTEVQPLALSREQAGQLWQITEEIRRTERMTPDRATAFLEKIEDQVLSAAQLMYTDQQFLTRDEKREPSDSPTPRGRTAGPGAEGETGGSSGIIATYAAGGPYNPLLDESRQIGQDFLELRELLRQRR